MKNLIMKKCPICGGVAKTVERGGGWTVDCAYDILENYNGRLYCTRPGTSFQKTEEMAIKVWNNPIFGMLCKISEIIRLIRRAR